MALARVLIFLSDEKAGKVHVRLNMQGCNG
jgi:hypothetical protein